MPILTKDGRGVLFIHIPKTGGSSIGNLFKDAGWQMAYHDGRIGKNAVNHVRWCTPQHMHGEMLRRTFQLEAFETAFMVVRDPIARFRSEYAWRNGISGTGEVDPSAAAVERWAETVFSRFEKNPFVYGNHIRPQHEFLVPGAQVFRFEDGLEKAVATLNEKHGVELPVEVPRARTSERTSGVSSGAVEISPALEDRLRRFYALDYVAFSY